MIEGGKILVTGADGFIGSHLVETLVRAGQDVRAFVLYNAFGTWGWMDRVEPEIRERVEIHFGDIRDPQSAAAAVQDCTAVFHLAALIGIPYSYQASNSYVETNVCGTLNLLQSAACSGVERFVQTSTSEVYGTAQEIPIDEHHPLNAQSPYAATKVAADQLALSFFRSFGLAVTVVRPFNTYGPRQSSRAVIPTIIRQIDEGQPTIRLGALDPTRDFNFVDDIVRGMIAAADADNTVGETLNLATGNEISIGQLAKTIANEMNTEIEIKTDAARLRPEASEVERLCGDASKMCRLTGWSPEYAGDDGFRRGLAQTIKWFLNEQVASVKPADHYHI